MIAEKDPYIKSPYDHLKVISQHKQKRLEYEAREKAIRDHNQFLFEAEQCGIEQGKKQGIEQGKCERRREYIRRMLEKGKSVEQIVDFCGYGRAEVEAVRGNWQQ